MSTIGEQRRSNYALQPMTKAAFVELVTADQPDAPPYFTYDAVLNSQERPTLDEALERELQPDVARSGARAAGGRRADPRHARPGEFAAAHLAGSINIGLGGQYATWAGTVLDREHPIVIIADPGREHEAAMRLGRIGFDHVVGYLKDGLAQPGVAPGSDGVDRARSARRSPRSGWRPSAERAAAHRRPRAARAAAEAHRRKRQRAAESSGRAAAASCRAIARCSSTAPAAIDRRLPRACCSAQGFRTSARLPAASRRGKRRSCRSRRRGSAVAPATAIPMPVERTEGHRRGGDLRDHHPARAHCRYKGGVPGRGNSR